MKKILKVALVPLVFLIVAAVYVFGTLHQQQRQVFMTELAKRINSNPACAALAAPNRSSLSGTTVPLRSFRHFAIDYDVSADALLDLKCLGLLVSAAAQTEANVDLTFSDSLGVKKTISIRNN